MRVTSVFKSGLPIVVGLAAVLAGCTVKYRHEVEEPGTPAQYTYGAGGFIRYDGYDDVAGDMQIASVDFRKPGSEVVVRLTGVVHIGDLEYYRVLQEECLDTADLVLFEGVKMEGQDEAPEEEPELGRLYSSVGQLLGLGFQKEGIDYDRPNFVHCDITVGPDDPLNQQVDTGQMGQALQMLGPLVTFKNLIASGPDGKRVEDALKHQMANVMMMQLDGLTDDDVLKELREQDGLPDPMRERAERAAEALRGTPIMPGMGMPPEMQEQILERRDAYVLEQLTERLEGLDHTEPKVIAVFYGAAHNPGLAAGLQELGYRPFEKTWLRAWKMNSRGQGVIAERVTLDGERRRPEAAPEKKEAEEPILF